MSRQFRITLSGTELALLEAIKEQQKLQTLHSALLHLIGRFAMEGTEIKLRFTERPVVLEPEPEQDVTELEAALRAALQPACEEPEPEPEPEPAPEPEEEAIPGYCDDSSLDVDGREYYKTHELYVALREKGHSIVDAVSFEDAIRAQAFIDNPPELGF